MTEDTDEWTERLLIATADDVDEWSDQLLAQLQGVSTINLAGEEDAFAATPSAIERAIRERSAGIDPKLIKSYYKRAQAHFDDFSPARRSLCGNIASGISAPVLVSRRAIANSAEIVADRSL